MNHSERCPAITALMHKALIELQEELNAIPSYGDWASLTLGMRLFLRHKARLEKLRDLRTAICNFADSNEAAPQSVVISSCTSDPGDRRELIATINIGEVKA